MSIVSEISDIIEELYEAKVAQSTIDKVDEIKSAVGDLEDEINDLEDKIKEKDDEIEDLEEQIEETPDYKETMQGYEEINFTATNFKDREMMEALQDALDRNITVDRITETLQQLF